MVISGEQKVNGKKDSVVLVFVFRNFYALSAVAILLIIGAFYLFVFRPQLQSSDVARSFSYRSQIEKLDNLKQRVTEIKKVTKDFDVFAQTDLDKLAEVLPAEKDLPNLIAQIDGLAKQSGLGLASFSISEQGPAKKVDAAASGGSIKELLVSLNLRGGGYTNLKQLISLIETNLRIMNISAFSFNPNQDGTFSLSFKTYFYN